MHALAVLFNRDRTIHKTMSINNQAAWRIREPMRTVSMWSEFKEVSWEYSRELTELVTHYDPTYEGVLRAFVRHTDIPNGVPVRNRTIEIRNVDGEARFICSCGWEDKGFDIRAAASVHNVRHAGEYKIIDKRSE